MSCLELHREMLQLSGGDGEALLGIGQVVIKAIHLLLVQGAFLNYVDYFPSVKAFYVDRKRPNEALMVSLAAHYLGDVTAVALIAAFVSMLNALMTQNGSPQVFVSHFGSVDHMWVFTHSIFLAQFGLILGYPLLWWGVLPADFAVAKNTMLFLVVVYLQGLASIMPCDANHNRNEG